MRNFIIFALALLLGTVVCFADGWTRSYGGSYFDYGSSIIQTLDGGYIVAGGTYYFYYDVS